MAWQTAAGSLTPVVAHDAITFSGSNLTDLTAGGRTIPLGSNILGCAPGIGDAVNAVIGRQSSMAYSSAVSVPTNATFFALVRVRRNTVLFSADAAARYVMAVDPYGEKLYHSGSPNYTLTQRGILALAVVYTGTSMQTAINGVFIGPAVDVGSSKPVSVTGMNYSGWLPWSDVAAIAIFSGAATESDLQTVEAAARSELAWSGSVPELTESFVSSIPADFTGFYHSASGSGTPTATHNAGAAAADLVAPATRDQVIWQVGNQPFRVRGDASVDLEVTADGTGLVHSGLWLQAADNAFAGIRLSHYSGVYYINWYGDPLDAMGVTVGCSAGFAPFPLNQRRVFRLKWELKKANQTNIEAYIDGTLVMKSTLGLSFALRPAVFLYRNTTRVHEVSFLAGSALTGDGTYVYRGLSRNMLAPADFGLSAPNTVGRSITPGVRSVYGFQTTLGRGIIFGTVRKASTPSSLPVGRPVRLYSENDGRLVASTESDPLTGEFSFLDVPRDTRYSVVAYDYYDKTFRAVIADNIEPGLDA